MTGSLRNFARSLLGRPKRGGHDPYLHSIDGILEVGLWSYGRPKVISYAKSEMVFVGSFCSIAADVRFMPGGEHRSDFVSTYPFNKLGPRIYGDGHPFSKGPIRIGSDVWIGRAATVLAGVTIGHGAVIGASAVVAKDVPPYAVISGNPATVHRYRFPEDTRRRLLDVAWWDWDEERIVSAIPYIISPDVERFLALCESGEL